jgi:hypothetical protein
VSGVRREFRRMVRAEAERSERRRSKNMSTAV